ncbi:MAG: hypothetical protein EOP56_07865 [Sphingobacteriales bacterium]|nr:MAG: hypothetical protein EOP56_07865 [Sphingobacteriales bacterium]
MRLILTLSLLAVSILCSLASCDTCEGTNKIVDQECMNITALMDSVDLNSGLNASIEMNGVTKVRQHGAKCDDREMVTIYGEKIKSTDLQIICDQPLIYGPGAPNVIMPGTNILDYTDRVDLKYNYLYASTDNVSSGSVILNASKGQGFKPGVYMFTITGTTSEGRTFTDTTAITYYEQP